MTDEITRACETCEHEQKSAVDNPCRNCLPSPRLPAWEPAEVEQTPAARIAELEAEVAKLKNWVLASDRIPAVDPDNTRFSLTVPAYTEDEEMVFATVLLGSKIWESPYSGNHLDIIKWLDVSIQPPEAE
jgi:hypothetical protein